MAEDPSPPERLDDDAAESSKRGHLFRYHLAAGFLEPGDTVVDAACGNGYGTRLLDFHHQANAIGVDRTLEGVDAGEAELFEADLQSWDPDFPFDVFVGFETIEHLPDFSQYVRVAKRAERWIVVSAPIVPTTHLNPWHVHNFAPGELASLFVDAEWDLFQSVVQPAEVSELYVFARR